MKAMPRPSTKVALDVEDQAAPYARFLDQLTQGKPLGADVSVLKIWVTEAFREITELMFHAAAPNGGALRPLQVWNVGTDILATVYKARPRFSATIYRKQYGSP